MKNIHDVALSMEHDFMIDHQINVLYSPRIKKINFVLVDYLLQHDRSGMDGGLRYEHGAVTERVDHMGREDMHVLQTVVTAETDQ